MDDNYNWGEILERVSVTDIPKDTNVVSLPLGAIAAAVARISRRDKTIVIKIKSAKHPVWQEYVCQPRDAQRQSIEVYKEEGDLYSHIDDVPVRVFDLAYDRLVRHEKNRHPLKEMEF
jgi:hypothetical protein